MGGGGGGVGFEREGLGGGRVGGLGFGIVTPIASRAPVEYLNIITPTPDT